MRKTPRKYVQDVQSKLKLAGEPMLTADQFELVVGAVNRAVTDAMREDCVEEVIAVINEIAASDYAENLR